MGNNRKIKVLVACEFSGIVRDAFKERGHDAWSCDKLPTERPGKHIQGDVLDIIDDGWDLMVAHPPCTYLANSGVGWLSKNGIINQERYRYMETAAYFFNLFLDAEVPYICVENPIMHGYANHIIKHRYSQEIQPYQFGHGETKATRLWLKGLPALIPTKHVDGRVPKCHLEWLTANKEERWKNRSRTYQGIADALAKQYGNFVSKKINEQ